MSWDTAVALQLGLFGSGEAVIGILDIWFFYNLNKGEEACALVFAFRGYGVKREIVRCDLSRFFV